jgi:3',5'-cyclic AMP phosphodiesterase CpdA
MTVVQISDLHFGEPAATSGDAALTARVKNWWGVHKIFEGYLGHSGIALRDLDTTFGRLKKTEDATLVVTGDISSIGGPIEFQTATAYITGTLSLPSGHIIGLAVSDAFNRAIPGNHDHWPGHGGPAPMYGMETTAFHATFQRPLWPPSTVSLNSTVSLRIIGIDTDADVYPFGKSRIWARGRFVSQLQALDNRLSSLPARDEVRVLLMHHSPQYQRIKLGINGKSQSALDTFVKNHEISVLLTGHTHAAQCQTTPYSNGGSSWTLLEARCGTTTQRDFMPVGWKPRVPALSPNSLLVHRIYVDDDGKICWRTNHFERNTKGFVDRGQTADVQVWPR